MNLLEPPTDEELAFHESGHVVVALELGLEVEWATLDERTPDDNAQGPMCRTAFIDLGLLDLSALHWAIDQDCTCLAGGYAGSLLFFEAKMGATDGQLWASRGTIIDYPEVMNKWPVRYADLIRGRTLPAGFQKWTPDWNRYVREATRITKKREASVKAVAQALVAKRTLWPSDFIAIAGQVNT